MPNNLNSFGTHAGRTLATEAAALRMPLMVLSGVAMHSAEESMPGIMPAKKTLGPPPNFRCFCRSLILVLPDRTLARCTGKLLFPLSEKA